jgi:hypothetical protein
MNSNNVRFYREFEKMTSLITKITEVDDLQGLLSDSLNNMLGAHNSYIAMEKAKEEETLETLIPAIREIELGHYDTVCEFLDGANRVLNAVGSNYEYRATSKMEGKVGVWGGPVCVVDEIKVVDLREESYEGD